MSWKTLAPNILHDQIRIYTFPLKLGKGEDWVPTLVIAGTTSALLAADPYEAKYFRTTDSFKDFNNAFSGNGVALATVLAPVALYGAGLMRHDSKMESTALFSGEAAVDAEILDVVLKGITRRERPENIPVNGNYRGTFFQSKLTNGGFPSGHEIAAFSIATAIAHRYRNHKWVPYAAYGAAGFVGFTRLTSSAHFVSDVFAGAALGYAVTRFGVLQY